MGFWDKLEKAAKKIEDFTAKADAYLDKTFPDEKEKYTKDEIYAYYKRSFGANFGGAVLKTAKQQNSEIAEIKWLIDSYEDPEFKTSSIKNLENGNYEIIFKGMISAKDEYGGFQGQYKFEVEVEVNCYRERVKTTTTVLR